eukprot:TRINITY_DN13306_c0_g1_i1.p1 TRINITY_DN13306_c0_g1~~TRINITY_DN13306_c0_g1_i1.p1  ORF type:complete len:242 (+),score=51.69 TRINITY_DN13306_c0_g1_i1:120-845(+)
MTSKAIPAGNHPRKVILLLQGLLLLSLVALGVMSTVVSLSTRTGLTSGVGFGDTYYANTLVGYMTGLGAAGVASFLFVTNSKSWKNSLALGMLILAFGASLAGALGPSSIIAKAQSKCFSCNLCPSSILSNSDKSCTPNAENHCVCFARSDNTYNACSCPYYNVVNKYCSSVNSTLTKTYNPNPYNYSCYFLNESTYFTEIKAMQAIFAVQAVTQLLAAIVTSYVIYRQERGSHTFTDINN